MKKVDAKVNFPKLEEAIVEYWEDKDIFAKSVAKPAPNGRYAFYDGPPFATGTPHYGHIVASTIKDLVPRYWTMRGYQVERKWGWDCHGLPIENIAEKELGITHKKEIETLGVEKFNEICRSKVLEYVAEWKKVMRRFGRWADMENAYRTMDRDFMESVWWVFKSLWDRGLIYESYRTMHICPRCETTLSQSEVAEGYKDVKDLAVTAKFEVSQENVIDVGIAFIERDGKYLFVHQKEEGQYFFVGGQVEEGESLEETIIRESKEELAIVVKPKKKLYQSFRVYKGKLYRLHIFDTEILSGEPRIQEDEHDEIVWRGREEVTDFYKDLNMHRHSLFLDGKIPPEINKMSFLAWTTTPWTLPGNVVLAVRKDIEYATVYSPNFPSELLILAKDRIDAYENVLGEYVLLFVQKGEQLIGVPYQPLFDYYAKDETLPNRENGWKIYHADFVTTDMGTGIAHEAPAFGEDDMQLGRANDLPWVQHVNMDGSMKAEATDFAGRPVKSKEDPSAMDVEIIKYLAKQGTLFAKEKYEHSYPHCWRCDTPLLNYATSSWFVNVTEIKPKMLELAENINWSPAHIKDGRWGKWLEGARDWSISRQRYWASVMPIWKCDCGELRVFGSATELEEASGVKVDDLHKHIVDLVTVPCTKCHESMQRVPDVLDTWFDSGSMPYAEKHYPFENKELFDATFPAQFIGTGIKDSNAFQNVVVNGIVLAEDGKKMSKKLKNYPDPMEILNKYGSDVLRYYLLSSPVVAAENLNFSERDMSDIQRNVFRMLWNSYSFFTTYAAIDNWSPKSDAKPSDNLLDRWILSELQLLTKEVNGAMEAYELNRATRAFGPFVDNLSNWYIRRSRKRFWKSEDDSDKEQAYQTLYTVLVTLAKLMAPFTPFLSEEIYRNLTGEESVHLADYPGADESLIDEKLNEEMYEIRDIVKQGLQLRAEAGIKVRQPLSELFIMNKQPRGELVEILLEELNVKKVVPGADLGEKDIELRLEITPELKLEMETREIIRAIQEGRKKAGFNVEDRITLGYTGKEAIFANTELAELIAHEVLATSVQPTTLADADYSEIADIEGEPFAFTLKRV